jgi:signal transduction histidine kinase
MMNEDHWAKEFLDDAHLHEREDRLARFDAHLPCLLFELERQPEGSLRFAFLSDACKDLLGIPRDLLYADTMHLLSRLTDEDHSALLEALERSVAQLKPLNWEGRLRIDAWKDLKWINLRATPTRRTDGALCWTGVMTNISQAKRLQEEIRQSREQLSVLAAHIEEVKEQERRRIERDLHDDLGGNLSALKMMLQHVWKNLPSDPYLVDRYAYFENLLDSSIASIHRISADLRPGILDAGLVAALEWLSSEFELQTGLACEFHCKDLDISLDAKLATTLFRIAQEACNNIRKHADASGVEIYLHDDGSELLMEIIDNGGGISNEQRDSPQSFGLRSMEERVAAIGGSLKIISRSGKGTMVSARAPVLRGA